MTIIYVLDNIILFIFWNYMHKLNNKLDSFFSIILLKYSIRHYHFLNIM